MFIVGLIGGIVIGKSIVLSLFKDLGCLVVDVDYIVWEGEIIESM